MLEKSLFHGSLQPLETTFDFGFMAPSNQGVRYFQPLLTSLSFLLWPLCLFLFFVRILGLTSEPCTSPRTTFPPPFKHIYKVPCALKGYICAGIILSAIRIENNTTCALFCLCIKAMCILHPFIKKYICGIPQYILYYSKYLYLKSIFH